MTKERLDKIEERLIGVLEDALDDLNECGSRPFQGEYRNAYNWVLANWLGIRLRGSTQEDSSG